jgi:hypothetical protein
VLAGLAVLTTMLVDLGDLRDRIWRGTPTIDFIAPDEPGPSLTFQPNSRMLRFSAPFDIEHTRGRNELIKGVEGTFTAGGRTILSFSPTDISCVKDGAPLTSITAGTIGRANCELEHTFSDLTLKSMQAPGPAVLELRFIGRYRSDYRVRYCLTASDGFWQGLLGSATETSRRFLNPKDCE